MIISGERIVLRRLTSDDVSQEYVDWLNDPKVNKYLECRHSIHTLASVREYVTRLLSESANEYLFGIFTGDTGFHIGNIKLGPIDWRNRHADVGIIIGNTDYWGQGYATEAISTLTDYSLSVFRLTCLNAGCYSLNTGSARAFLKAGWLSVGCIPNKWKLADGLFCDEQLLSFSRLSSSTSVQQPQGITLIGSGNVLVNVAKHLIDVHSCHPYILVAPRHKDDIQSDFLIEQGCEIDVVPRLTPSVYRYIRDCLHNRLCLCFGPAWIFDDEFIQLFSGDIFNFNGIPIPSYLGGAHYSWQILNQDRSGGAFVQRITSDIDRGPVVSSRLYSIDQGCTIPADYDAFNLRQHSNTVCDFIDSFLDMGFAISSSSQPDWSTSLYFPRLNTDLNGWINWGWDGLSIYKFCCAFDQPYAGACTTLCGIDVRLTNVSPPSGGPFHPYASGLIARHCISTHIVFIYTTCGIISAKIHPVDSSQALHIRSGDRLFTSVSRLDQALFPAKYGPTGLIPAG